MCETYGLPAPVADILTALIHTYGAPEQVLPRLRELLGDTAPIKQLKRLSAAFAGTEYAEMIRIDFSVVAAGRYYNGIVFKGFVADSPDSVLSGGQYDKLMHKMGRHGGAVGFAVYLDRLGRQEDRPDYDVDTLLLYPAGCDLAALTKTADDLRKDGSVMLQKEIPEKLTYRRLFRFENGEVKAL